MESEKGHRKLLNAGHSFYKNGENGERVYWECDKYPKTKCPARIITSNGQTVKSFIDHKHVIDETETRAKENMSKIRHLARSTQDTPQPVLSSVLANCDKAVAPKLPKVQSMKKTIRSNKIKNTIDLY